MLKKFSLILFTVFLCACHEIYPTGNFYPITNNIGRSPANDINTGNFFDSENTFKVAMLLPLSGKTSTYGQGLKNAAMMALDDTNNTNLILQFYDTKSTMSGAREAARQALENGSSLILGPLTSEEVSAVAPLAKYHNVPVISFSTSPSAVGEGQYSIGLLGNEQIDKIISYAASVKRTKLALMIPDNESGFNLVRSALASAEKYGVSIVKIAFYPPETMDFSETVKQLSNYEERAAEIQKYKNKLQTSAKAGNKRAANELKRLKTTYTAGELDFDAVLIPESGNRLKAAASMFSYYDVAYPDVLFLGTSVWENTNLSKETTLYHAVYPVISRVHNAYFTKKYQNLFAQKPNQLYSFAYDSVALASAIAQRKDTDITQTITSKDGYIGINGAFRILENGRNEHSLDVVEVTDQGPKVVQESQNRFDTYPYEPQPPYKMPKPEVYGQDPQKIDYLFVTENPYWKDQGNSYW